MTNQHPITPPPELVQQWAYQRKYLSDQVVFSEIAQWGADAELEKCCEALDNLNDGYWSGKLRAARRPKPPSLKEQALALLDPSNTYGSITREEEYRISIANAETIRRALEQLPE